MRARLTLALAACLIAAPGASAAWEPARLVSASSTEQAGAATTELDVSADGRFVVFSTAARNLFGDPEPEGSYREGGIFRKDLATGRLDLVASGTLRAREDDRLLRGGAFAPSVSADGRHVAFTTSARLLDADENFNLDVYVRDMARAPAQDGALVLASAIDGGDVPARYGSAVLGALAPATAGISDDGTRVAFTTRVASNLPAGGEGAPTPAGQVFVRDLRARRTTLVTVLRDEATGAASAEPGGGAADALRGVALSGDGTAVAWLSSAPAGQTVYLQGEPPADLALLWRALDDPAAPARRVAGASDPDDPACAHGGAVSQQFEPGPCDGFFQPGDEFVRDMPTFALSASGDRVAFVSTRLPRATGAGSDGRAPDLYLADMRAGVTRKLGVRELTREGPDARRAADSDAILSVALAADGRVAAIQTRRVEFRPAWPRALGALPPVPRAVEVYAIDLDAGTLELVTRRFDGRFSTHDATTPAPPPLALSANAGVLAFASEGPALVRGDANGASDAFLAVRKAPTRRRGAAGRRPGGARGEGEDLARRLRVTTRRGGPGSLILDVIAPLAGKLSVRAGARPGGATIARAQTAVTEPGIASLELALGRHARRALTLTVALDAPGLATITRTLRVPGARR